VRAVRRVWLEPRPGLYGLAAVAVTGPMFGVFEGVIGIINSFRGVAGEKSAILAATMRSLSEAVVPVAFGIGIGVMAWLFWRWTLQMNEQLRNEMECARQDLLNALQRL